MSDGAHMLPCLCPANAVTGEKEVFRLLENDPKTRGWIVLHSLDLAEHVRQLRGEADFVVLIPEQGILVLEVKSHAVVRFDSRGWWLGNAVRPEERGPFKQAEEAMHSIRNYLHQHGEEKSLPIVSGVIFTSASFNWKSPEWHEWQVLDRQSLHARPISENLLRIITHAHVHFTSKGLAWADRKLDASADKMNRVASILRPRFEMLASPAVRRKALDDNLHECTSQQFRFLDNWSENDRLLTSGLAGTGKTTLAIEAVRREKAANPAATVGFFCFNRLLGTRLALDCSGLGDSVKVGHFHQWMTSLVGISPTHRERIDPEFWRKTLPEKVLALLTSPGMSGGFLDYLVLDEAQDLFTEAYLDIFDLLLKGGFVNGRWLLVGDFERQDIYSGGVVSKSDFYEQRAQQRCSLFKLDENCRNTPEISNTLTMLANLKPGYTRTLRADTRHDPKIHFYTTDEEQLEMALAAWDHSLGDGFKPRDIVFLSPFRESAFGQLLARHPRFNGRLKEYQLGSESAGFTTIHAFKGLEAAIVILSDIKETDDAKRLDLFYVGMSRALHRLVILCHKSFKPTLQNLVL